MSMIVQVAFSSHGRRIGRYPTVRRDLVAIVMTLAIKHSPIAVLTTRNIVDNRICQNLIFCCENVTNSSA